MEIKEWRDAHFYADLLTFTQLFFIRLIIPSVA